VYFLCTFDDPLPAQSVWKHVLNALHPGARNAKPSPCKTSHRAPLTLANWCQPGRATRPTYAVDHASGSSLSLPAYRPHTRPWWWCVPRAYPGR